MGKVMNIILLSFLFGGITRNFIIKYVDKRYGIDLKFKIDEHDSGLVFFYKKLIKVPDNCPNRVILFMIKYVYVLSGLLTVLLFLFTK